MKYRSLYIILIIIFSLIPASYFYRYLLGKIRPRESAGRLALFFGVSCAMIVLYTFLLVLLITRIFPRP